MKRTAVFYALLSAVLFGLSTPAAKLLLGAIHPVTLAGILYCGAGVGIALLRLLLPSAFTGPPEVPVSRSGWRWLAGAIGTGGVLGPLLLMLGLAQTDAATASLLLTLESAATALMAWFIFKENFDWRIALGMVSLVAGAAVLSWSGAPTFGSVVGPLAIIGACIAWGLDNNLTRKISLSDPLQIAMWKGLVAGPFNLVLGISISREVPDLSRAALTGAIGFLSYGLSVALFVVALRNLGAARTGAYFSTAPFIGAGAALLIFGEQVTLQFLVAGVLMAIGLWLHLSEHHEHEHVHEPLAHAHPHVHDIHHQHAHGVADPPGEPHTHAHEHDPIRHSHPHVPDMHHTHR